MEYGISFPVDFQLCLKCRLVFQSPIPPPRLLATFYPEEYRNHRPLEAGLWTRLKTLQFNYLASTLAGHLSMGGRILEIGCGNGRLLLALKQTINGQFYGSDVSAKALAGLKAAGVGLKVCDIENEFPFAETFDAIIMNNVIEHFSDPARVLAACRERLAPTGKVILITPDSDALEFSIFGKYWAGLHAPRHTCLFNRKNIRLLGEKSGFKKIRTFPAADPGQWAISIQNLLQDHPVTKSKIKRGMTWYLCGLSAVFAPISFLQNLSGKGNAMLCVLSRPAPAS